MRNLALLLASVPILSGPGSMLGQKAAPSSPFSFRAWLENPPSLIVEDPTLDGPTVTLAGGDARRPHKPFTVDWGDGRLEEAFFPFRHTYQDLARDYTVTVTAHYDPGEASETVRVRFTSATFEFIRDPRIPRRVRVADAALDLGSTMPGYAPPGGLEGFAGADLAVPLPAWEYLLDVGHFLQMDFCNGDVDARSGSGLVVLSHPGFGGAYSLWYTQPVAVAADPSYLRRLCGLSSLYHELGHDLTLNTPARYRLGGRTDGPMSTVVSETLAQIMQHATAWEILNHPERYGLEEELADGLRRSALSAFSITARAYRDYVAQGCPFATYQGEGAGADRTFGTFMSLAYVFVQNAEERGAYRIPLKRTMALLQTFDEEDHTRYQERENDSFRATFLVAALSYGFDRDLRGRFRELRFALDDSVFAQMQARMAGK